jgi:hypothetical protein
MPRVPSTSSRWSTARSSARSMAVLAYRFWPRSRHRAPATPHGRRVEGVSRARPGTAGAHALLRRQGSSWKIDNSPRISVVDAAQNIEVTIVALHFYVIKPLRSAHSSDRLAREPPRLNGKEPSSPDERRVEQWRSVEESTPDLGLFTDWSQGAAERPKLARWNSQPLASTRVASRFESWLLGLDSNQ